MNPNNIQVLEVKEDTAEKIAKAAGKPRKNFLFAAELNNMAAIIRSLWALTHFNLATVAPNYKKDLGVLPEGVTFIQKINTNPPSTYLSPSYVTYVEDGITYVQSFIGISQQYGVGSGQVNESMFILLETSDELPIISPVDSRPYKVYSALLTQIGINDPVAIVLENTLGVTPTLTRQSIGVYSLMATPVFTLHKTAVIISQCGGYNNQTVTQIFDASNIIIATGNLGVEGQDDLLLETLLEIRVYN